MRFRQRLFIMEKRIILKNVLKEPLNIIFSFGSPCRLKAFLRFSIYLVLSLQTSQDKYWTGNTIWVKSSHNHIQFFLSRFKPWYTDLFIYMKPDWFLKCLKNLKHSVLFPDFLKALVYVYHFQCSILFEWFLLTDNLKSHYDLRAVTFFIWIWLTIILILRHLCSRT